MTHARLTRLPERNLDLLRAVAVLCVLVDHTLSAWNASLAPLIDNWTLGRMGVLFFFVHTALVLMSSIERLGTTRPDWIRAFYIRRTFRIYPLAIAIILLVMAFSIPPRVPVMGLSEPALPLGLRTIVTNLTLTQNLTGDENILGPLWSLPLEVQMYAFLPFCFLVARRSVAEMAAMLGALVAMGLIVHWGGIPGIWRLSMFEFGPCFAGGVLAYHLARRTTHRQLAAWTWPLAILGAAALLVASGADATHPYRGWLPCLFLGTCIPFIRETAASIVTRVAHKICEVSYGVYLLHVPVIWIAFGLLRRTPVAVEWLTFAVLIVALPYLAYRYLEKPLMRLGQEIAGRRATRTIEVGAP